MCSIVFVKATEFNVRISPTLCEQYMNVFAKFDEIPSMTLQDIKETKRNRHTFVRWDNVKTVYGSETHLREVPIYVKSRIVTS